MYGRQSLSYILPILSTYFVNLVYSVFYLMYEIKIFVKLADYEFRVIKDIRNDHVLTPIQNK